MIATFEDETVSTSRRFAYAWRIAFIEGGIHRVKTGFTNDWMRVHSAMARIANRVGERNVLKREWVDCRDAEDERIAA